MHEQQFDDVARALASFVTRRAGIRRIAAAGMAVFGLARSRSAASARMFLSAGDACFDSSQCRAADAPLVCADNGFDYDGPLNCCTFAGSRCFADEGCCGTAVCANGLCAAPFTYAGPGDPCFDGSQCRAADTAVYCDFSAATGDFRCCAYDGGRCGWDGGCCGAATCLRGICSTVPLDMGYLGPGEICQNAAQCGSAGMALTCDYSAATDDYRCCSLEGGSCSWDGQCCGWLTCGAGAVCSGGAPSYCNWRGCDCDFHVPDYCAPGLRCTAVQAGFLCL